MFQVIDRIPGAARMRETKSSPEKTKSMESSVGDAKKAEAKSTPRSNASPSNEVTLELIMATLNNLRAEVRRIPDMCAQVGDAEVNIILVTLFYAHDMIPLYLPCRKLSKR